MKHDPIYRIYELVFENIYFFLNSSLVKYKM